QTAFPPAPFAAFTANPVPTDEVHVGGCGLLSRRLQCDKCTWLWSRHASCAWKGVVVTTIPTPTPTPEDKGQHRRSRPGPGSRGHIGWIVAGSLATGLVAAVLLVAAPFIPPKENAVTGAVLCGFALGWAMLAVFSVRFTDQPQRWAAAPAVFMGLGGLLLVSFGAPVDQG